MRVAVIGSDKMDIDEKAMYKYISNVIYPHRIDEVVTTPDSGVADSARVMASSFGLFLTIVEDSREAVNISESVVVFRYKDEWHADSDYCARKGRPFKEYVVG